MQYPSQSLMIYTVAWRNAHEVQVDQGHNSAKSRLTCCDATPQGGSARCCARVARMTTMKRTVRMTRERSRPLVLT